MDRNGPFGSFFQGRKRRPLFDPGRDGSLKPTATMIATTPDDSRGLAKPGAVSAPGPPSPGLSAAGAAGQAARSTAADCRAPMVPHTSATPELTPHPVDRFALFWCSAFPFAFAMICCFHVTIVKDAFIFILFHKTEITLWTTRSFPVTHLLGRATAKNCLPISSGRTSVCFDAAYLALN